MLSNGRAYHTKRSPFQKPHNAKRIPDCRRQAASAYRAVTNKRLARRRYYDVSEAHKSLYCLWSRRRVQIRTHGVTRDRILN